MDTTELPIPPGFVPLPEVCSGCGRALVLGEEKLCVPGEPRVERFSEVSTFGARLSFGVHVPPSPTRLYCTSCAKGVA